MSAPNVRYLVLARLSDGMIAASYEHKRAAENTVATVKRVLTSGNLRARTQLTVTVNDVIGTLHITTTDEEIYAVITSSAYPRRSAFEMLGNLRDRAHQALGQESLGGVQKEDEKQGQFKGIMKDLASRYDEPYGDRAKEVGAKVDEVKAVMEGNIGRMLENAENLQNVQDKTESLRAGAQQFQKRSNQIRRQLWWRNFKMRAIIIIVVLCILGYILVPVIATSL